MGEKIKNLNNFIYKNNKIHIELNSTSSQKNNYEIHLQCDSLRIEMTDSEFYQIATAIMFSADNLRNYKKIK